MGFSIFITRSWGILEMAFNTVIEMVDEPLDWRDIPEYGGDEAVDEEPIFLDWEEGGK